ncbi:uncharacterized protein F5147DRAFT_652947 [Suillus discolor]|uniref:Uncharacterized protein n=1 Tax=Suillus discolor TaxID=1912936 RepID=A0A9P7F839_9AGAM|nr:uncharacterized protein F5147DRAFT_652947 [Suillus discolor]KAG2108225.1 hypothetical protein F5147DRAFT_652947 [Suillus discolor]
MIPASNEYVTLSWSLRFELLHTIILLEQLINCVGISPNGLYLAGGGNDGYVVAALLWHLREVKTVLIGEATGTVTIAYLEQSHQSISLGYHWTQELVLPLNACSLMLKHYPCHHYSWEFGFNLPPPRHGSFDVPRAMQFYDDGKKPVVAYLDNGFVVALSPSTTLDNFTCIAQDSSSWTKQSVFCVAALADSSSSIPSMIVTLNKFFNIHHQISFKRFSHNNSLQQEHQNHLVPSP